MPYEPKQDVGVRTIALLTVPNPSRMSIRDPRGASFGLAGSAVVAAGDLQSQEPLTRLATDSGFDCSREMARALTERLTQAGYTVIPVYANRKNQSTLHGDYSKIPSGGADAILDTSVNSSLFGYMTVNWTDSKFRPSIFFSVRMVDRRNRETIYAEDILFGYTNKFIRATKLKSPDRYFYDEAEKVLADGNGAIQGLRAGVDGIADHVVAQLKR